MRPRRRHYIYPDRETLAAAFVCEFEKFLKETAAGGKPVHVALSGGSTPLDVFRKLAVATSGDQWSGVQLYWGDERCVPPDSNESNYGIARKNLIDPLGLTEEQVHRIRGEEAPASEAVRYGNLLVENLPLENGFPVFDWIWLGMGEDGHTASIFPHQMDLLHAGKPCMVATHPDTAQKRITITGGVINAARRVTFLVTGENKSPVINEIVMKEGRYLEYPACHVAPLSGNIEWFLDKNATSWL
jgi:6-phosphogluconolactonase